VAFGALDSHGNICRGGEGCLGGGTGCDIEVRGPGIAANGEVTVSAVMGRSEVVAAGDSRSGSGGVGSLDLGNTRVALGARSSQGKIVLGFVA